MTPEQARSILATWRPGIPTAGDPELAEALRLAEADPALREWLHQRNAFHNSIARAVRSTPVPPDLATRILAARKTARPRFTPTPALWAAAAAAAVLVLTALLHTLWSSPKTPALADGHFDTFRQRMVRTVVREYRMDVVTNDLAAIRAFLGRRQAPDDFQLPGPLASLSPIGGGLLSWQGRGVSMVCLDGGRLGTLFLFVAPTDAMAAGRPAEPTATPVGRLATISWSNAGRTYVLAAHAAIEDLRQLFPAANRAANPARPVSGLRLRPLLLAQAGSSPSLSSSVRSRHRVRHEHRRSLHEPGVIPGLASP